MPLFTRERLRKLLRRVGDRDRWLILESEWEITGMNGALEASAWFYQLADHRMQRLTVPHDDLEQ